ncbi:MAG TPA: biotin--[acetyl-CoA-carboxylase] ligase [Jatrophihabitans sp.]|jgi:BirA family biotin operon repressor/biotin-[acetyl-CoA-carboxylase] ligase
MERDALDVTRLRVALGARFPRIEVVDETGSTNADLLTDVAAPTRSVLAAEFQNAGRGRLERAWTSAPHAGLTFSVLLRPAAPLAAWGWLPLLTGLAVRDALVAAGLDDVRLKWPNDVLIGDDERKICGILAQVRGDAVVIGIGLNVSTTSDEFGDLTSQATSLVLGGIENPDRTALLIAVLAGLDQLVTQWEAARGDAEAAGLAATYRAACSTLGRDVRVLGLDGSETIGMAGEVDSAGHLVLDVDGVRRTVAAGDVRHASPLPFDH